MKEMNILQKEDLPYFEELEKTGKAVILRFESLDDLVNFDLDALLNEDGKEPTLEEIQKWITSQEALLKEKHQHAQEQEKRILTQEQQIELLKRVQVCHLPDEDKSLVMQALQEGFPFEQILELMKEELTHEQRQLKYQDIGEKHSMQQQKQR